MICPICKNVDSPYNNEKVFFFIFFFIFFFQNKKKRNVFCTNCSNKYHSECLRIFNCPICNQDSIEFLK